MEAVNKYYLLVLGGSPTCKELPYKEWERLLSMYDHIQEVKRWYLITDKPAVPDIDVYVCGANYNLFFIKKRWIR